MASASTKNCSRHCDGIVWRQGTLHSSQLLAEIIGMDVYPLTRPTDLSLLPKTASPVPPTQPAWFRVYREAYERSKTLACHNTQSPCRPDRAPLQSFAIRLFSLNSAHVFTGYSVAAKGILPHISLRSAREFPERCSK